MSKRGFRVVVLGLCFCGLSSWTPLAYAQLQHSFVLRDTPDATNPETPPADPNTIFSYDTGTRLAVPSSDRLAVALAGTGALVDAMSWGLDWGHHTVSHSYFLWSVQLSDKGTVQAVPKTPAYFEPVSEAEADVFFNRDIIAPQRVPKSHAKSTDENGTSPVGTTKILQQSSNLGLTGTYGAPRGTPNAVSNVAALDYFSPVRAGNRTIYFSVDVSFSIGPETFDPADVLQLDPAGTISIYRTAESLGMTPTDNIDALAINFYGIAIIAGKPAPVPPTGWYSVTRDSTRLAQTGLSAADLLLFDLNTTYAGASGFVSQLHMSAESIGLLASVTIDADVDGLSHIDPEPPKPLNPVHELSLTEIEIDDATGELNVSPGARTFDSYAIARDNVPLNAFQGSQVTPVVGAPNPGDYFVLTIEGTDGDLQAYDSQLITRPSPVPPVTDAEAQQLSPTQVEWTWQNPVATYDSIEVILDGGAPQTLSATANQFLATGLPPGVHYLEIRGVDAGVRSEPAFAAAYLEPDPAILPNRLPPEDLEAFVLGFDVDLTWENPINYDDIEVLVNGNVVDNTGPAVIGAQATQVPIGPGLHVVSLRGVVGTSLTAETSVSAYISVPLPGDIIQSISFPGNQAGPIAIADNFVLVPDIAGPNTYVFPLNNLGQIPILINNPGIGNVTGIASDGFQVYWAVNDELWTTDLFGGNPQLQGPIGFVAGNGPAGDMTLDPFGALWIADLGSQLFSAHDTSSGAPLGPVIDHPQGGGDLFGITSRDPGIFDVTHRDLGPGPLTNITTLDDMGQFRATEELDEFLGIAFTPQGALGIPAWFAVFQGNTIVEIAALDPVPEPNTVNCHDTFLEAVRDRVDNIPIPDANTVNIRFSIPPFPTGQDTVGDVDVFIDIEHEQVDDLEILLTSPEGTTVALYSRTGSIVTRLTRTYDDIGSPSFNDVFGDRPPDDPDFLLAEFDGEQASGNWTLEVADVALLNVGTVLRAELSICVGGEPSFSRGNCNGDLAIDIGDAIFVLGVLFPPAMGSPPQPSCNDACDVNDDGQLNIADGIALLSNLFAMGPPPPPPAFCGVDPTPDSLDCAASPCP